MINSEYSDYNTVCDLYIDAGIGILGMYKAYEDAHGLDDGFIFSQFSGKQYDDAVEWCLDHLEQLELDGALDRKLDYEEKQLAG